MPYTTPKSWSTNEVVTAANLNTHLRDNVAFLGSPPACSAFHNVAVSVPVSTNTVLSANGENYDTDGMHSTVTNTSRITFNTAGRYLVMATVRFAATSGGARVLHMRINGGTPQASSAFVADASLGTDVVLSAARSFAVSAADYIEILVFQSAAGAINVTLEDFTAILVTV